MVQQSTRQRVKMNGNTAICSITESETLRERKRRHTPGRMQIVSAPAASRPRWPAKPATVLVQQIMKTNNTITSLQINPQTSRLISNNKAESPGERTNFQKEQCNNKDGHANNQLHSKAHPVRRTCGLPCLQPPSSAAETKATQQHLYG